MVKITEMMGNSSESCSSEDETASHDESPHNHLSLPMCRFGISCYRKNPLHFQAFRHPHKDSNGLPKSPDVNVEITIEIGHTTTLLSEKSVAGHTHDWSVFVRGINGSQISDLVEKVVFHFPDGTLSSPFTKAEPPFQVKNSGHASFTINIELIFKSGGTTVKSYKLDYNVLFNEKSSLENIKRVKITFQNPSIEFRQQILKAGGSIVQLQQDSNTSINDPGPSITNRKRDISAILESDECDTFGHLCATKLRKVNEMCPTQKLIAEKLISDVLYHAHMKALTTDSGVLISVLDYNNATVKKEPAESILKPDQIKDEPIDDDVEVVSTVE